MAKKDGEKIRREPTKRQLTRWQQEARRKRIILIAGIAIIIGALLTVGFGWYFSEYRPLQETVIRVNDRSFSMGYFIDTLKIYGEGQSPDYMYVLVGQVPGVIERNELIVAGAEKLGITVDDNTIKSELKKRNLPKEHWDELRAGLLVDRLLKEHFDPQVPQSAEQRHVMAMFLESKSQAESIAARLEKGEDFGALAKELSLDGYTREKSGDLDWHAKGVLPEFLSTNIVEDYSFGTKEGSVSPPMRDDEKYKNGGYWLLKVLERREEAGTQQAHVQGILASSAEEAQNIRSRLDKGEDFGELAKEFSQHAQSKDNGGDMGWLPAGAMGTAFDGFAFNDSTETGKLSDPVRDDSVTTKGGYWVVKVVGSEADQKVSDEDREMLKSKALNEWIAGLFADSANTIDDSPLTPDKMMFAVSRAMGE